MEAFKQHGEDFVVADNLRELVAGMNALTDEPLIDADALERLVDGPGPGDGQRRSARTPRSRRSAVPRSYRGDRLIRVATPHRLLDPKAGPLIAVRLNILTRKTLGGLETDLDGRVLPARRRAAAGPVRRRRGQRASAGGGMHGYNSLEGTFLGGCLFSGRAAGRAAAAHIA